MKIIDTVQRVLKSYNDKTIELWMAVEMNKDKFLEIHTTGIKIFFKIIIDISGLELTYK